MKYSRLFLICVGSISSLLLALACNSSSSGTSKSTQIRTLETTAAALTSLGSNATSFTLNNLGSRAQATDSICNANGTPVATANNSEWAFSKFLCAGAHNTYSPDSALGALYLNKGIICVGEAAGITYSTAGSPITLTNVALTTDCFSSEMLDAFAGNGISTVTGTLTGYSMDATTGWDFKLTLAGDPNIDDFTLYIRNSGNVIAAAFSSTSEAWTITLDRRNSPNELIFESASSNRHIRIMAEGTISATGNVSEVTGMAGILGENGMSEYVALRGDETNGVLVQWQKNGNGASDTPACYDVASSGATCAAGVTALGFVSTDLANFVGNPTVAGIRGIVDDNPISMTVAAFNENDVPNAAHASTLR